MTKNPFLVFCCFLAIGLVAPVGVAQTTGFTYQGSLNSSGVVANGNHDFEFALFDAVSGGAQLGATIPQNGIAVTNGIFAVSIDFGSQFPGAGRFLEIRVRPTGVGAFTPLTPRQPITSAPYAVKSLTADNATNSTNATTAVNFTGNLAGDVAGTQAATTIAANAVTTAKIADANVTTAKLANGSVTDAKIVDVAGSKITGTIPIAAVPSGSGNYIQNQNGGAQAASNFNISGTGSANIFNTATQYNINGSRVLGTINGDNLFLGIGAGAANPSSFSNSFVGSAAGQATTMGSNNSFFGTNAGNRNTTGSTNDFFGAYAGAANTTGCCNSFYGQTAGTRNTMGNNNAFFGYSVGSLNTTGGANAFFGAQTGFSNTTGAQNTLIGNFANVNSSNLTNATAIGANALVSQNNSLVLGSISGLNSASANTNVGIGTTAPTTRLHVSGAGTIRVRVNSDLNAGIALTLNNQPGWSVSTITGGQFQILNDGNGQSAVWIESGSNNVGIGTVSPGDKLDVNGLIRVSMLGSGGAVTLCQNAANQISTCSSSLRYKTNVIQFRSGLEFVDKLRPISFDWKDGGMKDVGLGAEDIATIDPRFVTYNDKGEVEGVKYDRIGVVLVNAIKEQQTQIEDQRREIERQSTKIDALMKLVCASNKDADVCKEN